MADVIILSLVGCSLLCLLWWWYCARWTACQVWRRQKIPGPPPNILLGNMLDYWRAGSPIAAQRQWFLRHTPLKSIHNATVGFFMGSKPALITTDPQLISQIFIRDAHIFAERIRIIPDCNATGEKEWEDALIYCDPKRYPMMRKIITQSFTPTHLRSNVPIILSAVEVLLEKLSRIAATSDGPEESHEVDMQDELILCSNNAFARCIFALDEHEERSQASGQSEISGFKKGIYQAVQSITHVSLWNPFLILAVLLPSLSSLVVPAMLFFWRCAATLTGRPQRWQPVIYIRNYVGRVIKNRKYRQQRGEVLRQDLLQTLISRRGELSDSEVSTNAAAYYVAATTTGNILSFVMHFLIRDQTLQDSVRAEVTELEHQEGELGYNVVTKLPLLDAVIKETMRLYPATVQVAAREARQDYDYKPPTLAGRRTMEEDGGTPAFTIPKGTTVVLGIHLLHRNPAYWPEPEVFKPDRFLPDPVTGDCPAISPLIYVPFGAGQRICPGDRFAVLLMKLIIARLLRDFRFARCDKTEIDGITVKETIIVQSILKGVWATVETV